MTFALLQTAQTVSYAGSRRVVKLGPVARCSARRVGTLGEGMPGTGRPMPHLCGYASPTSRGLFRVNSRGGVTKVRLCGIINSGVMV